MTSSTSQPYRHPAPGEYTLGTKLVSAGLAACVADLITFPLDTAKVRLQISNTASASITQKMLLLINGDYIKQSSLPPRPPGMLRILTTICRNEGPRGMYAGLVPGLHRQMFFCSIRVGFYDDVKKQYQKLLRADLTTSPSVFVRVLSGLTTGALCVTVAQPTDVVKIRMQAAGAKGQKIYGGVFKAYSEIARTEGIRGLWKGYMPNAARNSITNVSELVTYDIIKEKILLRQLMTDNFPCHVVCGFGAGFVATVIASPVDVVKTRYMSSGSGQYAGVFDCAGQMVKENGLRSLYKGFVPSFIRFGSWNILMFVCYEQIKKTVSQSRKSQNDRLSAHDNIAMLIPKHKISDQVNVK